MKNTIIFSLFCFLVCHYVHGQTQKQQNDSFRMRATSERTVFPYLADILDSYCGYYFVS